jgi:SsrA-binding protein
MMAKRASAPQPAPNGRPSDRVVTTNRRAFHEYFVVDTIEAGLVLTGTEIKSIRDGKVTISDAYARVEDGELWLIGSHISPYTHGNRANHDPDRPRKLLVHKRQLRELRASVEQKGMTIVPLRLALRDGRAKVDLGVVRGKKLYDKRDAAAERQSRRDVERVLRDRGDR